MSDALLRQHARVCAMVRKALAPAGLDVVIPLTLEMYNTRLADASLERFQLPAPSPSTTISAQKIGDTAGVTPHLLVLVGNSKALWPPFLQFAEREMAARGGNIAPDPIDRYVKQSVSSALVEMEVTPTNVYWTADTQPGKMILAQRMALWSRTVTHCSASQLCLHPTLGPWLAFRCALIFPNDTVAAVDGGEDMDIDAGSHDQPPLCSHSEELHKVLARQMDAAVAQSKATSSIDLSPGRIPADAWRAWALPRLTLAPNHPAMYPSEQILYHYTKDLAFLERVVTATRENRSTDYLRGSLPSPQVLACRRLIQQVLLELTQSSGGDGVVNGILLSGGLDTSILAEATAQPFEAPLFSVSLDKRDAEGVSRPILRFRHAFTVQAHPDAMDAQYASRIFERLGGVSIDELHVVCKSLDELVAPDSVRAVAELLCSFDPMELRNSLVVYAALLAARERGVTRLVTGDGADELFCGYSFYHGMDEDRLRAYRAQIAAVMNFTAPTLARSLSMEVVSPFLDKRVVEFASTLDKKDLMGERTPVPVDGEGALHGKLVLRQAFPEAFSQWRPKQPIESGAGSTALRLGFFDDWLSASELRARQVDAFRRHRVVVRDREHLRYFEAFLSAFGGDLGNVPKRRQQDSDGDNDDDGYERASNGFCPACGFELSHAAQDFCVTCGFWPARANETNDGAGLATAALAQLEREKAALRAEAAA